MQIETHIPLPLPRFSNHRVDPESRQAIDKMAVGDSVLISDPAVARCVAARLRYTKKKTTQRAEDGGTRIWRTA